MEMNTEITKEEWKEIALAVTAVALLLAMRNFQLMLL